MGFVSIFGVAVQDGVLLISYFNQMREAGLPVREAVMRGAELRVRPVVMTSLDGGPGPVPGRPRDLDRLAGPEAPGASSSSGRCSCTLFLTRYLMPVLYSFFPATAGHGECKSELILGSHYTDRFLHPQQGRSQSANHWTAGESHEQPTQDNGDFGGPGQ